MDAVVGLLAEGCQIGVNVLVALLLNEDFHHLLAPIVPERSDLLPLGLSQFERGDHLAQHKDVVRRFAPD